MIEELNKKIETNKDILSTLPKNNQKNIKKYKEQLTIVYNEYANYQKEVLEEILNRENKILKVEENPKIKVLKAKLDKIVDSLYLFSNSNTSYEKIGLDKIIYNISRYYTSNLDEVNNNINLAIMLFKKVGINLTAKDFNFSQHLNQYMEVFFQETNKLDSALIKTTFEKIYWQCSDLLIHLELNLKYLYNKYKKNFDNYCENLKQNTLGNKTATEIWQEYLELKKEYDDLVNKDILKIILKFKEKKLNINDFTPEKQDSYYREVLNDLTDLKSSNKSIIKFYYSLNEYSNYIDIKYILESIQKLYEEKNNFKNESKKDFKEINKLQNKLFKISKKIDWYKKLNKDYDNLTLNLNEIVAKLKQLYDKLDMSLFKERLSNLINDSSTYYEILELVYSNNLYLIKCIKENFENIETKEIKEKISHLKDILLSPYNNLLNTITIKENKDLKIIISDCYKLSNFNVNPELFDNEDDINNLKEILYKILVSNWIKESNIKVEDIKFYCQLSDMELN